jgi:hypothetical protein
VPDLQSALRDWLAALDEPELRALALDERCSGTAELTDPPPDKAIIETDRRGEI